MNNEHHAMLYQSDSVSAQEIPHNSNTVEIDSVFIERFGVDDARELVRKASNRPVEADQQLLVVRTNFITHEAQNALLKVLEEPPESTRFVFVVPRDFVVLPTLISRFSKQGLIENEVAPAENEPFQTFLGQGYKDRLASIDLAAKKQDVDWQRSIKQGLVGYVNKQTSTCLPSLKELEYVTRLLLTRGASNKMLLEHAAITLPIR